MTAKSVAGRVLRVAGVGVVIVLALVVILTALRTELPTVPGVQTDALGPESGERVDDYLARAAATLEGGAPGNAGEGTTTGDDDEAAAADDGGDPRWALVTARWAWSVPEAAGVVRELPRVSGLYVQVPVPGVAMPVTGVTLAEPTTGETSREPVFDRGIAQVIARLEAGPPDGPPAPDVDRAAATAALTASRLRSGEPGIIGMLVRGTTGQLRAVDAQPWVRAVEALPADAVWERFAVRPLHPQQQDAAYPLPDDAPVPPA